MKNLKLEVGKTYLTRQGERVKIVGDKGHEMFPFSGDNYLSYTLDGHWDFERDSVFDIIAEAPAQPEKRTFKLEVGKTYLNRKGERVKIVDNTGHALFPFDGDDGLCYTLDGRYWAFEKESHRDLVAEAEAQPEKRTFKIPENTREISVNETDGRIVIEFVPEAISTERERIQEWLSSRLGEGEAVLTVDLIEGYIKHREAQR